jgi:hypothetical protein
MPTLTIEKLQPAGLLQFLTSELLSPSSDKDRLHVRDNLQLAITDHERSTKVNPLLKAAGRGLKSAKETASKTVLHD